MVQAKFSITEAQADFVGQYYDLGFPDKSSVVREAIDHLRERLKQRQLQQSAELYAEFYAQDDELKELAEQSLQDWPE